jgi:hypothetical protein
MKKKIVLKTGQIATISGQYLAGRTKKEITLIKGDKVPPNRQGKLPKFTLVDRTKHKK